MTDTRRFQVASSNIIHDTIEGEVILLNLETGTYYQLTQDGVPIWNALVQGYPANQVAEPFVLKYPNQSDAVQAGFAQFIKQLEDEALLAPLAPDAPARGADTLSLELASTPDGQFVAPVLLKYTDMQALLLLDPIHDVDSQGWPLKPDIAV